MSFANGYEELRSGAAWFNLSARGRLRVSGEDRRRLLHAMTTQHIEGMKPGESLYTFFLNAQGRVLADAFVLCRDEDFLLDVEPETREKIAAHLDRYIIADDVTVEDITSSTVCYAVEGPAAAVFAGFDVIRGSATGAGGFRVIAPTGRDAELRALLTMPEAEPAAVEAVRLEHGVPRYGADITESHIAQETGRTDALHFNKGCYLGQEIVERVRSRGALHKKILPLRIAGEQAPAHGAEIHSGADKAGIVYSARYSPAEGCVRALGLMRLDYVEMGKPLEVGEAREVLCSGQ
jgi:aminomethyltransferase